MAKFPTLKEERKIFKKGHGTLAGIDEAGRGPLAGPVVAAAVVFEKNKLKKWQNFGIKDSKALAEKKRGRIYEKIKANHKNWAQAKVEPKKIDQAGITKATKEAMRKAFRKLTNKPDFLLIDGKDSLEKIAAQQKAQPKADQDCLSVAAASIIAKETRDNIMRRYAEKFPQYGFKKHKGYGTKKHRQNIKKHGACPIHRMSFAPLRDAENC